jgi:hypothetical protein
LIEAATILLIVSCIAVGVTAAVVTTWSLRARIYSLEDRVNIVEGVTTREVKIRAAAERFRKPTKDEELVAAALANPQPVQPVPYWLNPALKRGAYVP